MRRLLIYFLCFLLIVGMSTSFVNTKGYTEQVVITEEVLEVSKALDQVIVKFKQTPSSTSIKSYQIDNNAVGENNNLKVIKVPKGKKVKEFIKELEARRDVEYAEPNYKLKNAYVPNDPYYSSQWHLKKVQAEKAWDKTVGSSDVVVAVIDDGIDPEHPDLSEKIVYPYDMVYDTSEYISVGAHGTHVAGIIAGAMNNYTGGTGIAPEVSIMPINVFQYNGEAYLDDVINAVYYAVYYGADIINFSLGGPDYSASLNEAVQYAHSQGLLIVAAAGNNSSSVGYFPAALQSVISVSSTDENDLLSDFSNFGAVDISAPGSNVLSTLPLEDGSYGYMSGTSMAAPLVSGIAALIWTMEPTLTNYKLESRLESSVDDLGVPGKDIYFGTGRINAAKAVHTGTLYQPGYRIRDIQFNWGLGSPDLWIPNDNFQALFDQTDYFAGGDYFIQTLADDGVRVEVNNARWVIDRWSDSGGDINRSFINLSEGEHKIKTHYYENKGNAALFSHIVPTDSWLAYYYPNRDLKGIPVTSKVIPPSGNLKSLYEDFGSGGLADGPTPGDHFSARYTTAKRIPAGEYVLRARADDGIRVYVDGKLVLDRWTNSAFKEDAVKIQIYDQSNTIQSEKDVHWIEVQYYDYTGLGKVEFFLEPINQANKDTWVGEFFPNTTLQGIPYVLGGNNSFSKISKLEHNWGTNKPHPSIPADKFSARFTKKEYFEEGMYLFEAKSDDGIRVWVDNQLVINSWKDSSGTLKTGKVALSSGEHVIKVEYYENTGGALLSLNNKPFTKIPTQIAGDVHFNWGSKSPGAGYPADYFQTIFDQSRFFTPGDYYIQTLADDGIKVEVDQQWLINRWSDSGGEINRALWQGVSEGEHEIKTHYYERTGNATVFSNIVPFDSWLAYYYPNRYLSGTPTAAKVLESKGATKSLYEDYGIGSPATGVPTDSFSARFTTAKHIPAGEYILRARADDGIRVYVDGKLVLDRWTNSSFREDAVKLQISDLKDKSNNEKDVHWIEVQYYDSGGLGKVEFFLEPITDANNNTWVGEIYPTMTLQGIPYVFGGQNSINKLSDINFNWGTTKPHSSIPEDGFSARFTKKEYFEEGIYLFEAKSDDGIRIWVDDQLVINSWKDSSGSLKTGKVALDSGDHVIRVEYYENTGGALLTLNYKPFTKLFVQIGGNVHYNWGSKSPGLGYPFDYFQAIFDQTRHFTLGDYFIQTLADDGIKVEANQQWLINRWSDSGGEINRALWLGVTEGSHQVKTHYYESTGNATVFSDVVPFDYWLAYYYPNRNLTGTPLEAKVLAPIGPSKKLFEDFGSGSPAQEIPPDHFSARFTSAKRIPAGEYILKARADDGIRVYIDGKLVLDRWTNSPFREDIASIMIADRAGVSTSEKDVHWIEVQYYDYTGTGKVELLLE